MSIPCRISDYGDVISSYSVENLETLNPDFTDYVKEVAEVTHDDLPIVLNVVGGGLTQAQQKTVEETTLDDFAYDLGVVEKEERRHTWIFWFAGDTLVDYVLLTGHDLRQDRKLAGRLASMKVVFSETYEDAAYTQDEVDSLHSEIQDDIRGTIPKEC